MYVASVALAEGSQFSAASGKAKEILGRAAIDFEPESGLLQETDHFGRSHGRQRLGFLQHAAETLNVGLSTTHVDVERQGHGNQASILAGEEKDLKMPARLGHESNPRALGITCPNQTLRQVNGVLAEFAIGQGISELATGRVVTHARFALGSIVQPIS